MNKTDNPSLLNEASGRAYQYNRVRFWLNGKPFRAEIPPAQTTLEFLQQNAQLYGTKCSCNEGDCGACTVVLARVRDGAVRYEAVNSCLYNAARLHGKHLITVEGLGTPDKLHPIQQAMLDFHSTQCGYCSPGFVMSLFALLASVLHPSEAEILAALEGNLCRCTGYDSILQAARFMADKFAPDEIVPDWCRALEKEVLAFQGPSGSVEKIGVPLRHCRKYHLPSTLEDLATLLHQEPEHTIINGGTDIMVQMNVQRRQYPVLIDLSALPGLDRVESGPDGISIGANATYSDLLCSEAISSSLPVLQDLIMLVASRQIRNFATLSGNIANASPIGDTLPLLLALEASLVLYSSSGERKLPLRGFFLDYRKTALRPDEIIKSILIPLPPQSAFLRSLKAAKRKAVDISSVVSAVRIEERDGRICFAELALGGVAPVPKLSRQFHNALANMELQGLHPSEIADFVAAEFQPISDVRGSDAYRSKLIRNHVLKYLREFLEGGQS
ncbi:MAG: FAD binding domain-containing protein [Candidatus Syntrophosphaera sp.]|nr:FAD binding domain-containing protein [Candidatus Syntrophosphaera sp.]